MDNDANTAAKYPLKIQLPPELRAPLQQFVAAGTGRQFLKWLEANERAYLDILVDSPTEETRSAARGAVVVIRGLIGALNSQHAPRGDRHGRPKP